LEIYVDADACPVKDEVLRVAERHDLEVHIVSNSWMRMTVGPRVHRVVVSDGFDAADDWVADHISKGDICITADIALATRCLNKGARALGPAGKPFTDANIGMAQAMRDLSSHLRATGESRGLNPAFTKADRSRFLSALETIIQDIKRQG
jgi:uncharacterized protein YaiI (UPF0178 family)